MDGDRRFELYKGMYFFELQRKDSFNAGLQLPIGIVTILGGAVLYYARHFPDEPTKSLEGCVFVLSFGGGTLFLVAATYFLIRAWWGQRYSYVPHPKEIEDYFHVLAEYHEEYPEAEPPLAERFRDWVATRFIEAATGCTDSNDSKSEFLHRAIGCVIGAVVLLALSIVPYLKVSPES